MRAMLCHETGSIDNLVLGELPDPAPGPGQIAVEVHAAGLNFGDALMVEGSYQEKPALPFAPGMEVAGVVRALGAGVDTFVVGDRVLAMPGHGGYAEIAVAEASAAARIPDAMPFETAAGFAVTYCTAHGAMVWRGRLQSGELLMVHAAAGGVGLATVEVGKALGAEVIATAGGPDKLAIAADHGADHLIDYTAEDIRARVKDIAGARGQRGADVIFDPVGGDVFDVSLRSINFEAGSSSSVSPVGGCRRRRPISCWSKTSISSVSCGAPIAGSIPNASTTIGRFVRDVWRRPAAPACEPCFAAGSSGGGLKYPDRPQIHRQGGAESPRLTRV